MFAYKQLCSDTFCLCKIHDKYLMINIKFLSSKIFIPYPQIKTDRHKDRYLYRNFAPERFKVLRGIVFYTVAIINKNLLN